MKWNWCVSNVINNEWTMIDKFKWVSNSLSLSLSLSLFLSILFILITLKNTPLICMWTSLTNIFFVICVFVCLLMFTGGCNALHYLYDAKYWWWSCHHNHHKVYDCNRAICDWSTKLPLTYRPSSSTYRSISINRTHTHNHSHLQLTFTEEREKP